MDRELVEEKLESLRRWVRRLEQKRVSTAEQLADDWDTQDILSVNLTRAVQLCVDVAAHLVSDSDLPAPETMSEAFDRLHKLGVLGVRRTLPTHC